MPATDRFDVTRDCRAFYLQRVALLLRSGGILGEPACQAVLTGIGRHYDQMVDSPRRGSFREEARGLTSSRITLVCDDELELGIRLDNLTGRLFEGAASELWKVHLRFITLLGRPDLPRADDPLGPRGISEGLRALFQASATHSLDQKLDLIDRLEDLLLDGLPWVYGEVGDFLDQAGVAASQPAIVTSPEARTSRDSAHSGTASAPQALHDDLLARLPSAFGSNGNGSGLMSGPDIGVALLSQAAIDNLLFRLDDFERNSSAPSDFLSSSAPDLESLLPGLFTDRPASPASTAPRQPLNACTLGVPPGTAEGLAIDSVAMICAAIAADPDQPEVLKTLIASLQVGIIRVAIKDATLFTDAAHPCRQFIDGLGRAVLGLPSDASPQHPLCTQLAAVVADLRQDRSGTAAAYATATARLQAVIDQRHTAIERAAAAYQPLFAQLERRDQADREVNALFARLAVDQEPAELRGFLERTWRQLLEQIWLHDGPDSAPWQQHVGAIETLLWSFRPKPELAERKRMAQELPGVLRIINAGMERMQMAAEDRARVLDSCFLRQREALRRTTADPAPPPVVAAKRPLPPVTTETLKAGPLVLHTLDLIATPVSRQPPCAPGDWLALPVAGQRCTLRICQQGAASGRSLLFNPDFDLALAIHPLLLEQQLSAGEAVRLDQRSLFESAAAVALRESRA
ncbi:MAG TPA: DUF1631 family protein [Azonexus sp.]